MRIWWILLGILSGLVAQAAAVDIQYQLSSTRITGVSDTPLSSTPGHGLITILGHTAAEMQWPIPAGCASGRWEWTDVTNAGLVDVTGAGLGVRPGLILFSTTSTLLTGCHAVASWGQLKRLMDATLLAAALQEDLVQALAGMQGWFLALCLSLDGQNDLTWSTNANCVSWQASMDTINQRYPSRAQGATLAADMALLVTDAYAFRTSACAAGHTAFC